MIYSYFRRVADVNENSGPVIRPSRRSHQEREEIEDTNTCMSGRVWCVKDICGIVCVIFTYLLLLYSEFVVLFVMLIPGPYPIYGWINGIIFNILGFLAVASHTKAMLTDPVSQISISRFDASLTLPL